LAGNPEWELEKARQQHRESSQQAAQEKTAAIEQQVTVLDEILASAVALPPWSFERLVASPKEPRFEPGPLGLAVPAPAWEAFAPARPSGFRRFFGLWVGAGRYKSQLVQARARFAAAESEHQRAESERQQALAAAKARHHREITQERARAAKRNAYMARHRAGFAAGQAESVEWFVGGVLHASRYPDGFPRQHTVAYRAASREVAVDFELPPQDVVPSVRGYRYLATRDAIEPLPRPASEIRQRHERLVASVALRTLHEIFAATLPDVVEAVAFEGHVTAVDPATGRSARRHTLSVSATRAAFEDLVLAAVDPVACLAHLDALVSRLELHVAFRLREHLHQPAERIQVGTRFLGQRRPVPGLEMARQVIMPVLHRLLPRGLEQAELVIAVLVGSGSHGIRIR
jgi:restriction system protein